MATAFCHARLVLGCRGQFLRPNPIAKCSRVRASSLSMKVGEKQNEKLIAIAVNRGVDRDIAERVLACVDRAGREWTTTVSEFLTPPESAALRITASNLAEVHVASWGGYEDAERTAIVAAHSDIAESPDAVIPLVGEELALLVLKGNFEFEKASHRDFMGAILNAGVTRRKVGDIIVLDTRGAQVIVSADIAPFIQTSVASIRNVKVTIEKYPLENIEIPPKRVKELQSVEASMRVDAVVSAGFNISRSKLAAMTKSGLVYLNYKEVKTPAKMLKAGDVVSVRGVGKLEIGECTTTAKGRFRIQMKRYI